MGVRSLVVQAVIDDCLTEVPQNLEMDVDSFEESYMWPLTKNIILGAMNSPNYRRFFFLPPIVMR